MRVPAHCADAGERPAGPGIRDEVPVELRSVDLSGLGVHERELETLRLVREDAVRPFDLGNAPLMRTLLVRHGEQEYVLLVNVHHVAFDGWSRSIFVQELTECYRARVEGGRAALAALTTQYADFAQWQRSWLKDEELERQLRYWKTRLAQAPQMLELPSDFKRPQRASHRGATQRLDLPPEVFAILPGKQAAPGDAVHAGVGRVQRIAIPIRGAGRHLVSVRQWPTAIVRRWRG